MERYVHCRGHAGSPLVCLLSQMNSLHVFKSCFFQIRFNIIRPSDRQTTVGMVRSRTKATELLSALLGLVFFKISFLLFYFIFSKKQRPDFGLTTF
jgi:hypothetical protein